MEIDSRISIVISATVTGFSNLFTFDADEKFKRSGLNFEMRNELSYLQPGQSAYSISYAKPVGLTTGVCAFSRISRILDAYNRPGILVISLLLEQGTTLAFRNGGDIDKSIYDFIKKIDEKFCSLHFQRSSLDTNLAALGRNDYNEIIASYEVIPAKQKDFAFAEKENKLAYVHAYDNEVYKYFANPMRRNFNGIYRVFIGDLSIVPQNAVVINEPAEEVKMYGVIINGRQISIVNSLDAPIEIRDYSSGFEPISLTASYNAIKSGVDSRLNATLGENTINITYKPRIAREKFYGCFVREDKVTPFDISELDLQVYADNYPCDASRWSIENGDIYLLGDLMSRKLSFEDKSGRYKIISDPNNPAKFCVEPVFQLTLNFPNALKNKTVTFVNEKYSNNPYCENTFSETCKSFSLFGKESDWTFQVSSDSYKEVRGLLSSLSSKIIKLEEKVKQTCIVTITNIPENASPQFSYKDKYGNIVTGDFSFNEGMWATVLERGKTYTISCRGYKDKIIEVKNDTNESLEKKLFRNIQWKKGIFIIAIGFLFLVFCLKYLIPGRSGNSGKIFEVSIPIEVQDIIRQDEFYIESEDSVRNLEVDRQLGVSFCMSGEMFPEVSFVFSSGKNVFVRCQLNHDSFDKQDENGDTLFYTLNRTLKKNIQDAIDNQVRIRTEIDDIYNRYKDNGKPVSKEDNKAITNLKREIMPEAYSKKLDELINRKGATGDGELKKTSKRKTFVTDVENEQWAQILLDPKTPYEKIDSINSIVPDKHKLYIISHYLLECLKGRVQNPMRVGLEEYVKDETKARGGAIRLINNTFGDNNDYMTLVNNQKFQNVNELCEALE